MRENCGSDGSDALPLILQCARSFAAGAGLEKPKDVAAHLLGHVFGANRLCDRDSLPVGVQKCDTVQLARHLADALRVRYCFVTECTDESQTQVRALAFWDGKGFAQNVEYALRNTPCEKVIEGNICSYPERLQLLFPEDKDLVTLGAESYAGVPLANSAGQVLGHMVVMDNQPRVFGEQELRILRIFATRAGVELERNCADAALKISESRLRALLEINNAIIAKLNRDELFKAIADALGRIVSFDRLALSLHDSEANILRIVSYAGTYQRADYTPNRAGAPARRQSRRPSLCRAEGGGASRFGG